MKQTSSFPRRWQRRYVKLDAKARVLSYSHTEGDDPNNTFHFTHLSEVSLQGDRTILVDFGRWQETEQKQLCLKASDYDEAENWRYNISEVIKLRSCKNSRNVKQNKATVKANPEEEREAQHRREAKEQANREAQHRMEAREAEAQARARANQANWEARKEETRKMLKAAMEKYADAKEELQEEFPHITRANDFKGQHYKVLDIQKNATSSDIKKAYLKLAHQMHPDVFGEEPYALSAMQALNDAKDVLLDPSTKREYDRKLYEASGA